MKKFNIFIFIALVSILSACSEDYLVQNDPDALTSGNYWRNVEDAEAGLATVYRNLGATDFWNITEVNAVVENFRSDLVVPGPDSWNYPDWFSLSTFTYTAGNSRLTIYWRDAYRGLFHASQVIEKVGEMTADKISETDKNQIIAEAKFLRAFFHFRLLNNWENIIVIKAMPQGEDDLAKPLVSREEAWAFIEQDLTEAIPYLPEEYTSNKVGRATKGAAMAYLAKAYMYQEKWSEAAAKFKEVMDMGVYSLVDNFLSNFDGSNENNAESIFEIQYSALKTNNIWLGHVYGKFTSPGELGGWGNIEASENLFNFMISEGQTSNSGDYDQRLYQTLFFNHPNVSVFGQTYEDVFGAGATKLIFRKFMRSDVPEYDNDPYQTSMNIPQMRYADLLLMYAEAQAMQNNNSEAINAINMVRARSEMPAFNGTEVMQQIQHERVMELAYEGHRFFDLRRWGLLETAMQNSGKQGAENFSYQQHAFFPIPQDEENTNPNLHNNGF